MSMRISLILIILYSFQVHSGGPRRGSLSPTDIKKRIESTLSETSFKEIAYYSEKIREICPQDDCVVIGVGRSPTPFVSFLQITEDSKRSAFSLPLSQFRLSKQGISQEQRVKLYQYFDSFLPELSPNISTVALVDFTNSGESLLSAHSALEDYFDHKNVKLNIKSIALTLEEKLHRIRAYTQYLRVPMPVILELLPEQELFDHIFHQRYDPVSSHLKYPVLYDRVLDFPPEENKHFGRNYFLNLLSEKVKAYKQQNALKCLKIAREIFRY